MNMNEYQARAAETAIYPGQGTPVGLAYCGLKLAGEAGEASEHVGKAMRDDGLKLCSHGFDEASRICEGYCSRVAH